jgi:hypothetical protein
MSLSEAAENSFAMLAMSGFFRGRPLLLMMAAGLAESLFLVLSSSSSDDGWRLADCVLLWA